MVVSEVAGQVLRSLVPLRGRPPASPPDAGATRVRLGVSSGVSLFIELLAGQPADRRVDPVAASSLFEDRPLRPGSMLL